MGGFCIDSRLPPYCHPLFSIRNLSRESKQHISACARRIPRTKRVVQRKIARSISRREVFTSVVMTRPSGVAILAVPSHPRCSSPRIFVCIESSPSTQAPGDATVPRRVSLRMRWTSFAAHPHPKYIAPTECCIDKAGGHTQMDGDRVQPQSKRGGKGDIKYSGSTRHLRRNPTPTAPPPPPLRCQLPTFCSPRRWA